MVDKTIQKLGIKKRIPEILFDCSEYTISKIPFNYRIDIKTYCSPKHPERKIDRDCYSNQEQGLGCAKQMAEETIDEYFVRDLGVYQARMHANLKNNIDPSKTKKNEKHKAKRF
jgi:hypothetical protein